MKDPKYFEVRNIKFETQVNEGKKYLKGMIPYNSRSLDLGGYTEIVSPTAFNKTLKDGKNVWALLDHKKEKVLGNTRSNTLKLESTSDGLLCEVEVPNTSYANDAFELISRGVSNAMSFGFYIVKHTDDPTTRTRVLNEVKLEEVSFLVSEDPAYPAASAKTLLRSLSEDVATIDIQNMNEEEKGILLQIKEKIDSLFPTKEVAQTPAVEQVVPTLEKENTEDPAINQMLEVIKNIKKSMKEI